MPVCIKAWEYDFERGVLWGCVFSTYDDLRRYGIGPGHRNGIWGQFPELGDGNMDCVMEQVFAIYELKDADMPEPGFKVKKTIVRI